MEPVLRIYVIDDNPIDRLIGETLLQHTLGTVKVSLFSTVDGALSVLSEKAKSNQEELPQVILLDIDMPLMDGWSFLDAYAHIASDLTSEKPLIYLLTASINPKEKIAAKEHALVEGLLVKPLTSTAINAIKEKYFTQLYQL